MGCSPWGHEESDMTERLHFHFSLSCTGEGNGNPLQCSCLENLRDGGASWAAVYGVAQSRTQLKRLSSSSRRKLTNSETRIYALFALPRTLCLAYLYSFISLHLKNTSLRKIRQFLFLFPLLCFLLSCHNYHGALSESFVSCPSERETKNEQA